MDIAAIEREFGVTVGVSAWQLTDPSRAVNHSANAQVPAASTIKLFILVALLQEVAAGRISLQQELEMLGADQVGGTGVLNSLTADRTWTVHDLATLMIIVSDNTATNLLIDLLGVEFLNGWIRAHGWSGTSLAGRLMAPGRKVSSLTTPADLAGCMSRLWLGDLLPPAETAVARGILERQHYKDALGRELGFDAFGEGSGVQIASKSGSIVGVRNEVAVISREGEGYVVAIMTSGCSDERFWPDNPGLLAISRLNALLFAHFMDQA